MNETTAVRQIPRRCAVVDRDLRAAQEVLGMWRNLAGEFIACSLHPIIIIDGKVQPRDLRADVPDELLKLMNDEAQRVAELEYELHAAYLAESRA